MDNAFEERLRVWEQWGSAMAEPYQRMAAALPKPDFKLNFDFAQTLLARDRQLALGRAEGEPAKLSREQDPYGINRHQLLAQWDARRLLAANDWEWGWTPAEAALREEMFDCEDASQASRLAAAAMALPHAPWRRWCCASPIAADLWKALDHEGHKEPAIAPLGASALPALMGAAGVPVERWIAVVANAISPQAFVAAPKINAHRWLEGIDETLRFNSSCAPNLPTRRGCGDEYSKIIDLRAFAERSPEAALRAAAMGRDNVPTRESNPEPLQAALGGDFMKACLSQKLSGLPAGFDHPWPLAFVDLEGRALNDGGSAFEQLLHQGACVEDMHDGFMIWERLVEPYSEQGSEGEFAPVDDRILQTLFDAGADFSQCHLGKGRNSFLRATKQPEIPVPCPLDEYYRLVLDPHRANQAAQLAAPWVARSLERRLLEETPTAPHAKPKAL